LCCSFFPPQPLHKRGINFVADSSYLNLISLAGGNGILYERVSSAVQTPSPLQFKSDPPYAQLARCAEQVHSGDLDLAEPVCRAAIEEDPNSPWPYLAIVQSIGTSIALPDRFELAKRAIESAPDSVLAHGVLHTAILQVPVPEAERNSLYALINHVQNSEDAYIASNIYLSSTHGIDAESPKEQPEQVEEKFGRALQEKGDLVKTRMEIAEAYCQMGDLNRAITETKAAVRLEPDNSSLHQVFSELYKEAGDLDSEIAELREAIRSKPQAPYLLVNLAKRLDSLGRTEQALAELKALVARYPKDQEASDQLVTIYEKLKDRPSAIAEIRRHLKANPPVLTRANPRAGQDEYRRLALLLHENRDFDQSIEIYLDLLKSDPDNSGLHNDYGIVLLAQNKIPEASAEFKEALRIEPTMPVAHNNMGLCLMRSLKLNEAIAEYQNALELDPKSPHTRTSLGTALGMKGDLDGAIAQFREIIENDPDDAYAHANLGHALQLKKDFSAAIPELKKAVELDDQIPVTQNDLAWLYATAPNQKDRNPKEALVHAMHAVELISREPNAPPQVTAAFLDTLAEAQLMNGQPAEALANEEKALALDPNNLELKTRIEGFRAAAASHAALLHKP
jgi:tetratricopeptide (TPR) repeat protein